MYKGLNIFVGNLIERNKSVTSLKIKKLEIENSLPPTSKVLFQYFDYHYHSYFLPKKLKTLKLFINDILTFKNELVREKGNINLLYIIYVNLVCINQVCLIKTK